MANFPLLSFADAIKESEEFSKRHLILGNGFSIACRPDIFHYGSLFSRADLSSNPRLNDVFSALGTTDFEVAIRHLEAGSKLAAIYSADGASASANMAADAAALKEILVTTLATNHPNFPGEIPHNKFYACRRFLEHFLSSGEGQIFTLNYDLLLYWTLMHQDVFDEDFVNLPMNDGFGNDEADPNADYVVWQGEVSAHSARIHFLHGALHLFDAGNELQKFTWIRKNERLIDQSRSAIADNKFPVFVSEGSSGQKKSKIRHNAYLYQGFKQLTQNALQAKHCFFVHGHSLAENDDHILVRLGRGRFKKLYVSLFGDPSSEVNTQIINKAQTLAGLRLSQHPMSLAFYDANSAAIWG